MVRFEAGCPRASGSEVEKAIILSVWSSWAFSSSRCTRASEFPIPQVSVVGPQCIDITKRMRRFELRLEHPVQMGVDESDFSPGIRNDRSQPFMKRIDEMG